MRVGIVTVHDSANLGSCLQAMAMQELVIQNGDTPVFIRTRGRFTTFCLFLGYNNSPGVRSLKKFVCFLIDRIKKPGMTCKKLKKYFIFKKDWGKYKKVVSSKIAALLNIDVLLLGSDEIWNVRQPAFQNPLLYGENISAKLKFAYAVSVGNMEKNGFGKFPMLLAAIKNLNGILVRDDYTADCLQENRIPVLGKVCDPTLQVDIRKYMKNPAEVNLPQNDYIAIYSYAVDEKTVKLIKDFAVKHKLKTIAISLYQSWCDEYINCSPFEFGAVLSGANYVYTSTFHGTIFSTLYHTKFVIKPLSPKVMDVAALLGVSSYIIPEECTGEQFEEILVGERDYAMIEDRIIELRKNSVKTYLEYIHQEK